MYQDLFFEGKKYISSRRARQITNYSKDYIGQLCRTGKVNARMITRNWYVEEESILAHKNNNLEAKNKSSSEAEFTADQNMIPLVIKADRPLAPIFEQITEKKGEGDKESLLISNENFSKISFFTSGKKMAITAVVIIFITFVSFGGAYFVRENKMANNFVNKNIASLSEISAPFFTSASSSFHNIGDYVFKNVEDGVNFSLNKIITMTGLRKKLAMSVDKIKNIENPSANLIEEQSVKVKNEITGMVVAPSSGSNEADEKLKTTITNSFSDEVNVYPDKSGVAGVIQPVFRNVDSSSYIYAIVPVKDKNNK